jgi:hypothetical protein
LSKAKPAAQKDILKMLFEVGRYTRKYINESDTDTQIFFLGGEGESNKVLQSLQPKKFCLMQRYKNNYQLQKSEHKAKKDQVSKESVLKKGSIQSPDTKVAP